ncbi:MAG: PIG-L family deacetylase [Microthrixaceae bacterium]
MARAAAEGHRVVLVVATRGERGEPTPGVLDEGEMLWERRIVETLESARLLGVERVEFLGYVDSGMMGEPSNDFPYSFWQADVESAAHRLAAILREEDAEVLTVYDDFGGYGHPDHIQVHRVGLRAAELSGTPEVFQGTMNNDEIRRSVAAIRAMQAADGVDAPADSAHGRGARQHDVRQAGGRADPCGRRAGSAVGQEGVDDCPRESDRAGVLVHDHG